PWRCLRRPRPCPPGWRPPARAARRCPRSRPSRTPPGPRPARRGRRRRPAGAGAVPRRTGAACRTSREESGSYELVADIEQHFQHQLIALVAGIQLLHAAGKLFGPGPIVLLAVGGLEVGE